MGGVGSDSENGPTLNYVVFRTRLLCGRFSTRKSSGDETANVNFLYDIVHVLKSTAPPPQTAQHGVVTVRTQKYQPQAKRQNIGRKWNLDDKLNVSNVNRFTGSVYKRMPELSYAH